MTYARKGPEAIIWDMDGVLVDSGEIHYQSFARLYGTYRRDGATLSRAAFAEIFGMDNRGTITALFGAEQATPEFIKAFGEEKEALFRDMIRGRLKPLPGVDHWLSYWQSAGAKQALGSSAPLLNVEAILAEIDARRYFSAEVCSETPGISAGKPAPDIFRAAARELGVEPSRCLVIEDAVVGVQAALSAGMRCLAVCTTHPASSLQGADWVAADLVALPPDRLAEMWSDR